ncbi:MAG TPA: hypothetical protein DEH78_05200, partial [Solibacterales bacterium]|nr:hypothetical protein [Bryobacterales bacterium]
KIAGAPTSRWADGLYNELGAPVVAATLLLPDHLVVEGIVTAGGPQLDAPVLPKTRPQFRMPRAVMLNVRATLLPLVAEVTAILEWVARGDEIDDVRELLGKEVTFDLVAADVQGDLLAKLNAPNAAAPPAGDGDEHAQLAAGLEKAIHSRRSRRDVRADA